MPRAGGRPPDHGDWAYGVGKRGCEDALAAAFARDGFPSTRLRVPMINGERDYTRRLEGYLWRLLDGGPVAAARRRHPPPAPRLRAGRLARDRRRSSAGARTFGQAYNLCQEETPTLAELVEMLAGGLGRRLACARCLGRPGGGRARSRARVALLRPLDVDARSRPRQGGARLPGHAAARIPRLHRGQLPGPPPASPPDAYADRRRELALA